MKLKQCVVLLLILACAGAAARAQSGRKQSGDKSSNGASGRAQTSPGTTGDSPGDEGLNTSDTYEGETVEGDVVRVNTSLVTVPVSVMDRSGKYIPDLAREDFHIFEEGVEQRISYFAAVDQPFTVALVIDTSGSTDFSISDMQKAAISFVNQLKPEDRVIVVSFDDSIDVRTKAPTNDREEIIKAIRRTSTGGSTRLYDAVDEVMKKHLRGVTGRKAVVLFTDGVDTTSRHASYESTVRDAEKLDALIYSVAYDDRAGAGSLGGTWGSDGGRISLPGGGGIPMGRPNVGGNGTTSPADYERGRMYLSELSQVTGGRLYNGSSMLGLSQAFAYVADELRRQYSLGYYPKRGGQVGQRRRLKVRVNQPNMVVQARDSYVYTPKGGAAAPPDKQQFSKQETDAGQVR